MKLDFVSIGEVMIQLNSLTAGPLRSVTHFEKHVAGSEANTMIGLRRLDFSTGLITRVGNDEFGKAVVTTIRGEDVDASHVIVDDTAPTGIYFVQRHFPLPGESTVTYYRRGSAASNLSESDVDEEYVKAASSIHITGITPALSPSCRKAVAKMKRLAKANGSSVSFDTNIRPKLWKDKADARETISQYLDSEIVFTNLEDLFFIWPNLGMKEAASRVLEKGASVVVVKLGKKGAYALTREAEAEAPAFAAPHVEDVVGAGDAFDSAFLACHKKGFGLEDCLRHGNVAGTYVVGVRGDIEALPTWEDLKIFFESVDGKKSVR